jgi:hypothetical protein
MKNAVSVKNGGDSVTRPPARSAFIASGAEEGVLRSSERLVKERIHRFRLRVTAVHPAINFFSILA